MNLCVVRPLLPLDVSSSVSESPDDRSESLDQESPKSKISLSFARALEQVLQEDSSQGNNFGVKTQIGTGYTSFDSL